MSPLAIERQEFEIKTTQDLQKFNGTRTVAEKASSSGRCPLLSEHSESVYSAVSDSI